MARVQLTERHTARSFQVMDFAESCMDYARTPPDAEVTHGTSRHDTGAMLSMRFHNARRGGHRVGFGNSLTVKRCAVSDSQ